jgi:MFS family permease
MQRFKMRVFTFMMAEARKPRILRDAAALIPALVVFIAHAWLGARYDLFRDELYFIVCGQHPAFGYVDQPPAVPLMAAALFKLGLGAWGVRLPAALAAGLLVWLAVRFARLLGGSGLAIALTALSCAIAPMLMGMAATLNTSTFDPLAWTVIAYLLTKALRENDNRALALAGLVAGVALEIKYAVVFWMVGLTIGLLLTPERRILLRPAFWVGATIAALIAAPSFAWQLLHGFPFLELGAAAKEKNANVALAPFMANQAFVMNPLFAPLCIAGLVAPFLVARLKDLRFVAIGAIVVVIIVRWGHGKDYYLAPLYPSLFVIGAVTLAPLASGRPGKAIAGIATACAVIISALVAPMALPVLPPATLASYIGWVGFAPAQQERSFKGTVLPQVFADQLGWHDFTGQVEAAWDRIPVSMRADTGIKVDNYGEAAALDIYGQHLPPALTGHNQYFLWGLRGQNPRNLLVVQDNLAALIPYCENVTPLGKTWSRYAMAYENSKVIALCEKVRPPLIQLWPRLKNFS